MQKRFDSINVIPFIDIMLVLLAIVLMTATFIVQGDLDVQLPVAENSAAPEPELEPMRIAIDAAEDLYWAGEPIDLTTLDVLLEAAAAEEATGAIVLSVDQRVPFRRFVEVVDLIKGHGLERMSIRVREGA